MRDNNEMWIRIMVAHYKHLFEEVWELELSHRTRNILSHNGITHIGDLVVTERSELCSYPGLGKKVLAEIETELAKYHFELGTRIPWWRDERIDHEDIRKRYEDHY